MTDDARGGVDEGGTKRNLAEPRKVVRILDFTLLQLKSYYEIRKKQRAGGIPSHLGEGRRGGLRSPVTAVSALEGERLPGELEENSEQSSGDGWQTQFDRDASRPASMLRLNSRSACKIDPLPKRSSSMPLCSARRTRGWPAVSVPAPGKAAVRNSRPGSPFASGVTGQFDPHQCDCPCAWQSSFCKGGAWRATKHNSG